MSIIKKNKGITLIALIVTIVVLLILAGVTINAITGSESAMEKATEAREKDKQGTELEAIKLAVVNSVASDLTGLVNVDNLKDGLNGIVEDEGRLAINKNNSPWQVIGKTGKTYEISQNGNVEVITGVILSTKNLTLEIKDDTYGEDTITARLVDIEGTLTWTASSDIIEITPSTDGRSATIKAVDKGNAKLTVECSSGDKTECIVKVTELVTPKIGDYIDFEKDLVGNNTTIDDWKILYKDSTNKKIYAILSNYLPNNRRIELGLALDLDTNGDYNVKLPNNGTNNAKIFADILKGDWNELISSRINKKIDIEVHGALERNTIDIIKGDNEKYYQPIEENNASEYWLASNDSTNKKLWYVPVDGNVTTGPYYASKNLCPIAIFSSDTKLISTKINGNTIWSVVTE